jgi:hypothetical protein
VTVSRKHFREIFRAQTYHTLPKAPVMSLRRPPLGTEPRVCGHEVVDRGLLNRWVARALPPAAAGLPIKKFGGGGPPGRVRVIVPIARGGRVGDGHKVLRSGHLTVVMICDRTEMDERGKGGPSENEP